MNKLKVSWETETAAVKETFSLVSATDHLIKQSLLMRPSTSSYRTASAHPARGLQPPRHVLEK